MNKELKDHIDAMDDDEKYTYHTSLRFLEKVVDIIGISIILLMFLIPNILLIMLGVGGTLFFGIVGGAMKEARVYIEEKLELR